MTAKRRSTLLNSLSRILELEFGAASLQNYGLFDADIGGLGCPAPVIKGAKSEALEVDKLLHGQQLFQQLLFDLVSAKIDKNSSILLAGESLLPLATKLTGAGFFIQWVGPRKSLGELAGRSNFQHCSEDILTLIEPLAVDLLILQGSIRYLDQMALLSKCRDFLSASGQLLLFSEFILDDSLIEYSTLPNFSSFRQLCDRLGFEQKQDFDLSNSAAETLALVNPMVAKHERRLIERGELDAELVEELYTELAKMQQEFASGRRGFRLLVLTRDVRSNKEWTTAEFGDINSFQPQQIADLFEQSFKHSFNAALWDWKYNLGDGKCVIAKLDKQGEIVAHYGGAPRKIRYFGRPSMAIQPCDVMVHPSVRKQYGKGSLFFEVAATFLEREIGNTVQHLLGFGFPNQKTMNISKRLGLYEKTDDFIEIVYPAAQTGVLSSPLSSESSGVEDHAGEDASCEIDSVGNFSCEDYDPNESTASRELDQLWLAMREDFSDGIIGVRDSDYVRYRYFSHPFAKSNLYRCVTIRETKGNQAIAFAVLKRQQGYELLMDLVCPVALMKIAIAVLNHGISPDSSLRIWVTKSGQDKVAVDAATVNELGIEIPCNSWNPGPSSEILAGAWWLTAGDMDFV